MGPRAKDINLLLAREPWYLEAPMNISQSIISLTDVFNYFSMDIIFLLSAVSVRHV